MLTVIFALTLWVPVAPPIHNENNLQSSRSPWGLDVGADEIRGQGSPDQAQAGQSCPFGLPQHLPQCLFEAHTFEACCLWKLDGTLRVGTYLFQWDKADSSVVWQTTNFRLFYTLLPTQRCEAHNDVPQTLLQILTSTLVLATSLLPLTSSTCPLLYPSGPNP